MENEKLNVKNEQKKLEIPDLDLCIDWCQFTILDLGIHEVLLQFFGVIPDRCTITNTGKNGYSETYTLERKIHVMHNPKRPDMGVNVLLSGFACREFEQLYDWQLLFKQVLQHKHNFNRIDIAIDMYKKFFSISKLKSKARKGELTSKFKKAISIENFNISGGDINCGESLTFGKKASNVQIQFYDKLEERKGAGYNVDKAINFWNRAELRFRSDLSEEIAKLFVENNSNIGSFIYGVLKNYLDFKKMDNERITRCSTWEPYAKFLGNVQKIQLSKRALQSTLQTKDFIAKQQFSKTFAMLQLNAPEYFKSLMYKGLGSLTDYDLKIINEYRIQQNMKVFTLQELQVLRETFVEQKSIGFN